MLHHRPRFWIWVLACSYLSAGLHFCGCNPPGVNKPADSDAAHSEPPEQSATTNSDSPQDRSAITATDSGAGSGNPVENDIGAPGADRAQAIARAAELTRLLLTGNADAALQQFSPLYRDQISIADLRTLSRDLQKLFGTEIAKLGPLPSEIKSQVIEPSSFPSEQESLLVRHLVDFVGGKQALSTVQFSEPPTDQKGSAQLHLAAIDVRETWPSYSPDTVRVAEAALNLLFRAPPADQAPVDSTDSDQTPAAAEESALAEQFQALLHPDAIPHFRTQALGTFCAQLQRQFGSAQTNIADWSHWSYQTQGQNLSASGTLRTDRDRIAVQFDFAGERLIGVTLIGKSHAASTLDLISPQQAAGETGQEFWSSVFSGQLERAYALLAPPFQKELPFADFTAAVTQSELTSLGTLQAVELDTVRLSNRLERANPVAFAAFYLAEFADGSEHAVQCEFGSQAVPPPLLSFANDFDATIPATDSREVERVVQALLSNQPEQLKQVLDSPGRDQFMPSIAAMFLSELQRIVATDAPEIEDVRVLHRYRAAQRSDHLRATIVGAQREVPLEAVMQSGQLKSFSLPAPELQTFVQKMEQLGDLEELGREFLRQWMKPELIQQAADKMLIASDPNALRAELAAQRDSLLSQHGHYLWSDLLTWQVIEGSSAVSAVYEMEFGDATLDMQLIFEVNAIGAKISAASILAPTK